MHNLFKNVQTGRCCTGIAAGSTVYQGNIVDTLGFSGIAFKAILDTLTTAAVGNLHAEMAATTATTDMVDVEASAVPFTDALQGTELVLDLGRPKKRYYRPVVHRATANAVIASMEYYLYNPTQAAVNQSTAANSLVAGSTFLNNASTGASTGS